MNISVESNVPPGFRFHPTEEELLLYYLRKKVGYEKIDLDVICDIDLNKHEPWDIQEKCKIGSTPQNDWYFFSHKDKKYPSGTRTNRATATGFWKATGRDKVIYSNSKRIGMRKTLVFYRGRAPHGHKSDWIMHEYRLDDSTINAPTAGNMGDKSATEDGWVVCRVFKKKSYHKTAQNPSTSSTSINSSNNNNVLNQIITYMERSCKQQNEYFNFSTSNNYSDRPHADFINIESPSNQTPAKNNSPLNEEYCGIEALEDMITATETSSTNQAGAYCHGNAFDSAKAGIIDWAALHPLMASHQLINGETQHPYSSSGYGNSDQDLSYSLDQLMNTSSQTHQPTQVSIAEPDCWGCA